MLDPSDVKRRAARFAAAILSGALNTGDVDMWPELDEEERLQVVDGLHRIIQRLAREGNY